MRVWWRPKLTRLIEPASSFPIILHCESALEVYKVDIWRSTSCPRIIIIIIIIIIIVIIIITIIIIIIINIIITIIIIIFFTLGSEDPDG